jgi:hypothetical protein
LDLEKPTDEKHKLDYRNHKCSCGSSLKYYCDKCKKYYSWSTFSRNHKHTDTLYDKNISKICTIKGIEPNEVQISKIHIISMYIKVEDSKNVDVNQLQFLITEKDGNSNFGRRVPITFSIVNPQHPEFEGNLLVGTHKFPSCDKETKVFVSLVDKEDHEILPRMDFQYSEPIRYHFDYVDVLNYQSLLE